jgi:hypothetical protein
MDFQLTNGRYRNTEEELLNDLRKVANNLGKDSLKMRDYSKKNGAKYSAKGITKRIGNWQTVLEKAGLKGEKSLKGIEFGETKIQDKTLIDDLIRVSTILKTPNISLKQYDKLGNYTSVTMSARFGSWNKAKEKANLQITPKANNTNEELFDNILDLWTLYGKQPKFSQVVSPNSKFHGATYARRFGSWRSALEAFVNYINNGENTPEIKKEKDLIPLKPKKVVKKVKRKRTTRNINLRLRFMILQRDNFSCKKCGRSPAKDTSVILHIDHIIPWSKGGETEVNNLETLCKNCNLGKSNVL